jgi:hypothetical protein
MQLVLLEKASYQNNNKVINIICDNCIDGEANVETSVAHTAIINTSE